MGIPFIYPPGAEIIEDLEMDYGEIRIISIGQEPYEAIVTAFRKRYHVIFGHAHGGNYLCIPNLGFSSFLPDSLSDFMRNRDYIRAGGIPWPEAGMLAQAICELRDYMDPQPFRPAESRRISPEEVDGLWY